VEAPILVMPDNWKDFDVDRSAPPIFRAIAAGDLDELRRLILRGDSLVSKDALGCSPLGVASRIGDNSIIQHLLDCGVPVDDVGDSEQIHLTPLMHATNAGHLQSMTILLDHGADVNRSGIYTPLYLAVLRDKIAAAQLLLSRNANPLTPVRLGASAGETAVEKAALSGSTDLFSLLLSHSKLESQDEFVKRIFRHDWYNEHQISREKRQCVEDYLSRRKFM